MTIDVPAEPPAEVSLRPKIAAAADQVEVYKNDFNFDLEYKKSKLVNAIHLLKEPLNETVEALKAGGSRLLYLPCILDYYADDIASPKIIATQEVPVKADTYFSTSFGNDKSYSARRRQAEQALSQNIMTKSETELLQVYTPPPHARFALELLGSIPWPHYPATSQGPLRPNDSRFHRRHIFCPFTDSPDVPWPVAAAHKSPTWETVEGQSPFKSIDDISLRDNSRFLLVEWIEENPLMLHTVGMSAGLTRFWRYRTGNAKSPDPHQSELLGPFGQIRKLEMHTLPRVYGGGIVRMESHCVLFESSLIRAPFFVHKASKTDFLLCRYRSGSRYNCVLKPIDCVYVGGQMEPITKVEVPLHPRMNGCLRGRVFTEAKRFWKNEKKLISTDYMKKIFPGEHKAVITRYTQEANREISENPDAPFSPGNLTPEEHCKLESMKEGLRRLKRRGISNLSCMQLFRVRQYIKEIEAHEELSSADSQNKVAYECLQLEHELQIAPWNLTSDYHDVIVNKKGFTFAFTPIGDPSGGRGEGLSFIRSNREQPGHSAKTGGGFILGLEGDLRTKTKTELMRELKAKGVPERVFESMSRWQMLKHLTSMVMQSTPALKTQVQAKVPLYQRRQLQTEKINSIWWKQAAALSNQEPPRYEEPVEHVSEEEGEDDLLADMLQDPVPEEEEPSMEIVEDEEAQLKSFKDRLAGKQNVQIPIIPEAVPVNRNKVDCLKVVHTGRDKSSGTPWTRITYVYGKLNIELYKRWRKINYDVTGYFDRDMSMQQSKPNWEELVEEALRVHKHLQQQLATQVISAYDPKAKRCQACQWLGHDASHKGCPMYPRDEEEEAQEEDMEIVDAGSPVSDDYLQPVIDDEGFDDGEVKRMRTEE